MQRKRWSRWSLEDFSHTLQAPLRTRMKTVQNKKRSGPQVGGLSRCAACYKQNASSMHRWGDDGESSSSAEDSGPEVDLESEAESSSSSSSSSSSYSEKASPVPGDGADAESGVKDGDGRDEASRSQEDKSRAKRPRRSPLVKSFSLPTSLTPHLTPLSLLPRPQTVVSTLHLQVLSQDDGDCFYIVKQQLPGREEEEKTGESHRGREGINSGQPPQAFQSQQTGLSWQQRSHPTLQQHQLSYQQQHQQHFSPLSAQAQRLPPPRHTLPVPHPPMLHTPLQILDATQTHLHAPQTRVHALQTHLHAPQIHVQGPTPQLCWYCYSMHFPYMY
ncbi:uncharacterized protein LOC116061656 isoform X2 [Sander lucioperca]|uniref:uncharacterized protein LOC116061656 isoform X2 n=1 Tax=Sander lucioperca TaxID=283035 RepID=UPI001653D4E3|nr:uncharacterized protein LOC116061656 isoform X2 [Sander lucioperca]